MNRTRSALLSMLTLLCLVSACNSLGLVPAKSFDDRLAYAYGVHTGLLNGTAAAITAGALTKSDGQAVLQIADDARRLLDAAQSVSATDQPGADRKLVLATAILTQLQNYLSKRGVS